MVLASTLIKLTIITIPCNDFDVFMYLYVYNNMSTYIHIYLFLYISMHVCMSISVCVWKYSKSAPGGLEAQKLLFLNWIKKGKLNFRTMFFFWKIRCRAQGKKSIKMYAFEWFLNQTSSYIKLSGVFSVGFTMFLQFVMCKSVVKTHENEPKG